MLFLRLLSSSLTLCPAFGPHWFSRTKCVCVCVCVSLPFSEVSHGSPQDRKKHTTAPCSRGLRDLLRQSLAAAVHSLPSSCLLFGSRAMQAAGIEPAPLRHEPGDLTTGTAPTTTHYTDASTDGTSQVHRLSLWPSQSLTGQDKNDGYNTHKRTAHGFMRPQASLRLLTASMRVCVCGVPLTGLPAFPTQHWLS